MKEIVLPNKEIIVVDETAEIKEGDFVFNKSNNKWFKQDSYLGDGVSQQYYHKIIASSFFIDKDIPMYKEEDNVEKLGRQRAIERRWHPDSMETRRVANEIIEAVKFGYKAAQSKGCYTEKDMIEFAGFCCKPTTTQKEAIREWALKNNGTPNSVGMFEIFQSLKDKPVEFEMDNNSPECGIMDRAFCIQPICGCLNTKIKTTRDENGQLWCKLKK